jgi:hypothetical protein
MLNPWLVSSVVAVAGASAIASFSRHWLIGAIAFGIGTPIALAIGEEMLSGRPNKFIAVFVLFAWFFTVPSALLFGYLTFRLRISWRDEAGGSTDPSGSGAPPNNRWRGP